MGSLGKGAENLLFFCSSSHTGKDSEMFRPVLVSAAVLLSAIACQSGPKASPTTDIPETALTAIDSASLAYPIRVLSSDVYQGRGPGTHGEELTIQFLTDQFVSMGLAPGTPTGPTFRTCLWWGSRRRARRAWSSRERAAKRRWPGGMTSWPGPSTWPMSRPSTARAWYSSATGSRRPSSTGTTTRAKT